jgi:hypothetical protein
MKPPSKSILFRTRHSGCRPIYFHPDAILSIVDSWLTLKSGEKFLLSNPAVERLVNRTETVDLDDPQTPDSP